MLNRKYSLKVIVSFSSLILITAEKKTQKKDMSSPINNKELHALLLGAIVLIGMKYEL